MRPGAPVSGAIEKLLDCAMEGADNVTRMFVYKNFLI